MKKALSIVLALVLVLSLVACAKSDAPSGGNTPSNDTSNQPTSQGGNDTPAASPVDDAPSGGGNSTDGWEDTFAAASGIPFLTTPLDCEASYDANSPRTVKFTAETDITDAMFTLYGQEVFDICRASSKDNVYYLDYDGFKKGDEVSSFSEYYVEGSLTTYFYYTFGEYISQIQISAKGKEITVKINDVYNSETQERAKP